MKRKGRPMIKNAKVVKMVIIAATAFCFLCSAVGITHAIVDKASPNIVITVHGPGTINYKGSLFSDDLWYPGMKESGVIRINNKWGALDISRIGLKVDIIEYQSGYKKDEVYQSFLENMKLTVEKGNLLQFDEVILDNKSFSDLLYQPGSEGSGGFWDGFFGFRWEARTRLFVLGVVFVSRLLGW